MAEAISRPEIIIDSQAAPEAARRIQDIDAQIHTDPEAFIQSLRLTSMQPPDQLSPVTPVDDLSPVELLTEIIARKYDAEGFDNATEEELAQDTELRRLSANHLRQHPKVVKDGEMRSRTVVNPEAKPAANALRRRRLELYLGRVGAYNAQQYQQAEFDEGLSATG